MGRVISGVTRLVSVTNEADRVVNFFSLVFYFLFLSFLSFSSSFFSSLSSFTLIFLLPFFVFSLLLLSLVSESLSPLSSPRPPGPCQHACSCQSDQPPLPRWVLLPHGTQVPGHHTCVLQHHRIHSESKAAFPTRFIPAEAGQLNVSITSGNRQLLYIVCWNRLVCTLCTVCTSMYSL